MQCAAPSARARSSFSSDEDVTITLAPIMRQICSAASDTPPVPRVNTVSPAFRRPSPTRAPRRQPCGRNRRGLRMTPTFRRTREVCDRTHGEFRCEPVNAIAGCLVVVTDRIRWTAIALLRKEAGDYMVARLELR